MQSWLLNQKYAHKLEVLMFFPNHQNAERLKKIRYIFKLYIYMSYETVPFLISETNSASIYAKL